MKIKFLLIFSVLIMLFVLQSSMSKTNAEESHNLDLETFPKVKFLEMDNLKPGDSVESALDVINNGNILFTYKTTASFAGGSTKYYDALRMDVKDEKNNVLFSGRLKDFRELKPRRLLIFTKDHLTIKVQVPADLGNEYQALSAGIKLTFTAEGDTGNTASPEDGKSLPNTAMNIYNYVILGLILIGSGIYLFFYRIKREHED